MKKVKVFRFYIKGFTDNGVAKGLNEIEQTLEEFMRDKQIFSITQSSEELSWLFYTIIYEEE